MWIYYLQDHLCTCLVYLTALVESTLCIERQLMVFLSVDITADDIAIDLNLQVNPLAHRSRVAHLTVLRLRAVATYLYGVLCIGPAANVPPRVVVFVLIVEDDEESLCSAVFAGTESHSVCRTFKRGVADASAALIVISAACCLFLYTVANAP